MAVGRLYDTSRQNVFCLADMEDYGFEYSDEELEEQDVDIENQYYNSKGSAASLTSCLDDHHSQEDSLVPVAWSSHADPGPASRVCSPCAVAQAW